MEKLLFLGSRVHGGLAEWVHGSPGVEETDKFYIRLRERWCFFVLISLMREVGEAKPDKVFGVSYSSVIPQCVCHTPVWVLTLSSSFAILHRSNNRRELCGSFQYRYPHF